MNTQLFIVNRSIYETEHQELIDQVLAPLIFDQECMLWIAFEHLVELKKDEDSFNRWMGLEIMGMEHFFTQFPSDITEEQKQSFAPFLDKSLDHKMLTVMRVNIL